MTKLLKRSLVILMATMALALTPMLAWAVDSSVDVNLYKDKNTVAVELQNPQALDEDVNAVQLTLSMDAKDGSMDGITPGFVFNTAYSASIKQARYDSSVHALTLYIAGAQQNLLPSKTKLLLGWVVFNTVSSANANFAVNVEDGSLSLVGALRNPISGDAFQLEDAQPTVAISGNNVTVTGDNKYGSSEGGSSGFVGGNPQNPLPSGGYDPEKGNTDDYNQPNAEGGAAEANPQDLDPTAGENADEGITSDSNVSPTVAEAQRNAKSKTTGTQQLAGLPIQAIIGIVVGVIVIAGLLFLFLRSRGKKVDVPRSRPRR